VNKLRTTGLLLDKKQKYKSQVRTEEELDDIGARLEHTPRKSLKRLVQEIGVSKSSARTRLLKRRPYKTTVIAKPCSRAIQLPGFIFKFVSTVCRRRWDRSAIDILFWWSVVSQNNRYWSSQNPRVTHEVLLHPVKVGVWCAVSAKRIVRPVFFFNETINCETHVQVIPGQFFPDLTEEEKLYGLISARLSYCSHCTYICAGFVRCLPWRN
jgi:hypothetical protein